MCSKTAQVVLVENYVPPQALCLSRRSPSDLGSYCLPRQEDLIKPCGRDADSVPIKEVGKIFKASPMLRPRPTSVTATSSLATIAETEQPILIEDDDDDDDDDDDAKMTGGSAGSASAEKMATTAVTVKRRPALKVPPSSRPKAVLKSTPSAVTRVPHPAERYVVPRGPAVAPNFRMADFPMVIPGLPSSIASSPATTLAPATPT